MEPSTNRRGFLSSGRTYLTRVSLRYLTTLEVSSRGISDLRGIEHATQLETLNLRNNRDNGCIAFSRFDASEAFGA